MKRIHLHIDRIAVEGLGAAQQRGFARALEERLRAFAATGIGHGMDGIAAGRIGNLNAGTLRPGATAGQAAAQVVRSIRQRLAGSAGSQPSPRGGEARKHG